MAVCGWGSFLPHISTMFSEFPWWRQPRMAHSIVDIYTTGASTRADDSSSWWSMSSQHIVEWSESGTFAASMRRALITVSVTQGHRDGVLPSLSNWMPITFSYTVPDARACLLSPHLLSPLLWEFRFWGIQLFGTRVPTSLPVAVDAPKSEFSRRGEKRWGDNSLVVNYLQQISAMTFWIKRAEGRSMQPEALSQCTSLQTFSLLLELEPVFPTAEVS